MYGISIRIFDFSIVEGFKKRSDERMKDRTLRRIK